MLYFETRYDLLFNHTAVAPLFSKADATIRLKVIKLRNFNRYCDELKPIMAILGQNLNSHRFYYDYRIDLMSFARFAKLEYKPTVILYCGQYGVFI